MIVLAILNPDILQTSSKAQLNCFEADEFVELVFRAEAVLGCGCIIL